MKTFYIYGSVHDYNTFYCEDLAKRVCALYDDLKVEFTTMYEVDFWSKVNELKDIIDPTLMHHRETHLVIRDKEVIGDIYAFISEARDFYGYEDAEVSNTILFNRMVRESSYSLMKRHGNPVVTLTFGMTVAPSAAATTKTSSFGGGGRNNYEEIGMIHIELFDSLCPSAVKNFQKLINGIVIPGEGYDTRGYKNCAVHRIVKHGWLQTGDIFTGTGENSMAATGRDTSIPDECFAVDFSFPHGGIVGYANEGAHSSKSQFFITLGPCAWMNQKFQGFGRVIQGFKVLHRLNDMKTSNQQPIDSIKIVECGIAPELLNPINK